MAEKTKTKEITKRLQQVLYQILHIKMPIATYVYNVISASLHKE